MQPMAAMSLETSTGRPEFESFGTSFNLPPIKTGKSTPCSFIAALTALA
jgi:hypothetical protein